MNQVDAVVLAGARNTGRLREVDGSFYEASIQIAGRPMVYYVLDALAAVPEIRRIVVAAPPGAFQGDWQGKVSFVPAGDSLMDNIRIGMNALDTDAKVLIVTSDIPFSTRAVSDLSALPRKKLTSTIRLLRQANDRDFPVCNGHMRLREGVLPAATWR